jgi:hypothetical protein
VVRAGRVWNLGRHSAEGEPGRRGGWSEGEGPGGKPQVLELLWLPMAAFEIPLGFWLLIKGVRPAAGQA